MSDGDAESQKLPESGWQRPPTGEIVISLAVSAVALGFAIAHLAKSDIKVDNATVGLVVIAAIPWLAPVMARYVKSFKAPGGWEVNFQELQRKVEEAQGAAQSAAQKADTALVGAAVAAQTSGAPSPPPSMAPAPGGTGGGTGGGTAGPATADETLRGLMEAYEQIRATQKPGSTRTTAMTAIFSQMMAVAPKAEQFDVGQAMRSANPGERLAAYAYLYAQPQANLLDELVDSVTRLEDTPFGQYWGLQAVERVLSQHGTTGVSAMSLEKLRRLYARLGPGTDRHYELGRILQTFAATEVT
jgi:hypothetical protein